MVGMPSEHNIKAWSVCGENGCPSGSRKQQPKQQRNPWSVVLEHICFSCASAAQAPEAAAMHGH